MMEDSIRIRTYDGQYRIIGGDFQSMLALVRQMPGRRYQSDEHIWEVPQHIADIQKAAEAAGFHVTSDTEMGRALPQAPKRRRGGADRVLVQVAGQTLAVVGGQFMDMVDAVKAIEGRRFSSASKVWELPGTVDQVTTQIATHGYRLVSPDEADQLPAQEPRQADSTPAAPRPAREVRRDQVRVSASDGDFWLTGRPFREILDVIKGIDGRRFESAAKLWTVPITGDDLGAIIAANGLTMEPADGPRAAPAAQDAGPRRPTRKNEPEEPPPYPFDDVPPEEDEDDHY